MSDLKNTHLPIPSSLYIVQKVQPIKIPRLSGGGYWFGISGENQCSVNEDSFVSE